MLVVRIIFTILLFVFGASAVHAEADSGQAIVIKKSDDHFSSPLMLALDEVHEEYGLEHYEALQAFYARRQGEAYWTRRSSLNRNARDFLDVIEESWTHGVNPYAYHFEALQADPHHFHAEILLSDAFVRYGQDLSGIRVNPKAFKSHQRYWQQPMTAAYLLSLLDTYDDIEDAIAVFTPRGRTYNRLRDALIDLVEREPPAYEAVLPIVLNGALKPGDTHEAVANLRVRLKGYGGVTSASPDTFYDDVLAATVMRFQEKNGLTPDAVVGPETLHVLNVTKKDRAHQIIANLERLRWVPEEKPDRFIVVNVPSAMLWAIDEQRVKIEMPVIVGREDRPTNIFITDITGVRFNPDWTVPPTIKREDLVPKLAEDPYYLVSKGMELVSGRGEGAMSLNPALIDWASLTQKEMDALRMTQVPGDHNPLGRVRVHMPNNYNIYLHDTNEPELFAEPGRAVSSGCVRLKRPFEIAHFIMDGHKEWSQAFLDEMLENGETNDMFIRNTIPVYIVYYTSWINGDDEVVYGRDLYQYDTALIKMLSKLDEIFIPVDNT